MRWTPAWLALALLAGCGDSGSGSRGPASPAPAPTAAPAAAAPTQPAPAAAAASPAAPPAARPGAAPANVSGGDPARGAPIYATYCASCHGEKGCGDGPLSATLNPKPAKHCDGNLMNPLEDAFLFRVVKEGGQSVGKSPLMAPWGGSLSDAQIIDVIAFVRTLANPPYHKPAG